MSIVKDKLSFTDDNCIVVEFSNVNKELSVAFSQWISSDLSIQDLINSSEDVEILWPGDLGIAPANKMKKALNKLSQKSEVLWKSHAVKIIDFGSKISLF